MQRFFTYLFGTAPIRRHIPARMTARLCDMGAVMVITLTAAAVAGLPIFLHPAV